MERKFKVGDNVTFDNDALCPLNIKNAIGQKETDLKKFIGAVCEVTNISLDANDNPRIDIRDINTRETRPLSYEWRWKKFTGKVTKSIIEMHIALKDSTQTIVSGIKNSYQEAEDFSKKMADGIDVFTIYKLIPVAKIQNSLKVTKIKNGKQ